MDNIDRKAATAAWKERKAVPGIFRIDCTGSGETWVGSAPDLATIQNRQWFSLRMGSHNKPALQAAWRTHGEDNFAFAVVEAFDDADSAPATHAALKARVQHWADQIGAATL